MQHLPAVLWTLAAAMLFYWFVAFAAMQLIDAQHNPTVTHYQHRFCPAGPTR